VAVYLPVYVPIYIYYIHAYIIIVDLSGYTLSKRTYALCSGKAAVLSETIADVALGVYGYSTDAYLYIQSPPKSIRRRIYIYYTYDNI